MLPGRATPGRSGKINMAKRQCDPTSGSIGLHTYLQGRNGQVVRFRATPSNPKSAAQVAARNNLGDTARLWRALTDAQRDEWTAAALGVNSRPRLGSYGALTGEQLYCRINIVLVTFGQERVDVPPAFPTFPDLAVTALVITNTGGTIALKLTAPSDPGEMTIIRGSAAVSAGINRPPRMVILGTCPGPVTGSSTITPLYTPRYGVPTVGKRVFIAANQYVSGWESDLTVFNAVVPTAT